ncbi:DUF6441 family protein [Brevundimonas sp.]|uniref:DUF6441 family protein n=1 Tax=Brevundimonas sp. TaxID=1871086 RepID=UPI002FCB0106
MASPFSGWRTTQMGDQIRSDGSTVGGRLSRSGEAGLKIELEGNSGDFALALQGRLQDKIEADLLALERAYHGAMTRVVEAGKGRLRADIVAGGFHQAIALSKTWRATVYPKSKNSLEVAGWFYTKAGLIIDAFENGVTIKVSNGSKFLAVPLAPAKAIIRRLRRGKMTGSRDSGPGRDNWGRFTKDDSYIAQVGAALGSDLIPIIAKDGQTGVLVAANDVTLTRTGREAKNQNRAPTPIFALTKTATLRRRIKGRQILDEIAKNFPSDFVHALAGELSPENRDGK